MRYMSLTPLRLSPYRFEYALEDRRGLRLHKERLKRTVHHLRMALMVRMEEFNRLLAILGPIPPPDRTPFQFTCFGGKGMGLEVMNHL
jgi:hypothetical protein